VVTICTAQWSLYVPHSGHYMYHQFNIHNSTSSVLFLLLINPLKLSGHYMYRTVVTICTTSLTFNNSAFFPHSVFMCFVWLSEQPAMISRSHINGLVGITETESDYCAVRTASLYIILHIQPSTAQWSLYVNTGLTFHNSTFCPHSVFMCFVWIWEHRAHHILTRHGGLMS
jgi:F0F1-type ATP synthase assembly protein I